MGGVRKTSPAPQDRGPASNIEPPKKMVNEVVDRELVCSVESRSRTGGQSQSGWAAISGYHALLGLAHQSR